MDGTEDCHRRLKSFSTPTRAITGPFPLLSPFVSSRATPVAFVCSTRYPLGLPFLNIFVPLGTSVFARQIKDTEQSQCHYRRLQLSSHPQYFFFYPIVFSPGASRCRKPYFLPRSSQIQKTGFGNFSIPLHPSLDRMSQIAFGL